MILAVFLGGGVGALLRWACSRVEASVRREAERPVDGWGTTVANLLACAVMAFLVAQDPEPGMNMLLAAGFCGGLSTFSTYALELAGMWQDKRYKRVAVHLACNVVLGTCIFALMLPIGRLFGL